MSMDRHRGSRAKSAARSTFLRLGAAYATPPAGGSAATGVPAAASLAGNAARPRLAVLIVVD